MADEKNKQDQEKQSLLEDKSEGTKYNDLRRKISGLLALVSIGILDTVSFSSVQLLEKRIPDFELNTFRSASPLLFYLLGMTITRKWPLVPKSDLLTAFFYVLLSFIWPITVYIGVTFLPLTTVQCVMQTTNIATGVILFYIFLKETVSIQVFVSALVSICGVIMVIQPDFIFNHDHSPLLNNSSANLTNFTLEAMGSPEKLTNFIFEAIDSSEKLTNLTFEPMDSSEKLTNLTMEAVDISSSNDYHVLQWLPYLLPVTSGLTITTEIIYLQKKPCLNDRIIEVMFWCFLSNSIISMIVMFLTETPTLPRNWYDTLLVTLHCLAYVCLRPLHMYAFATISGNTVSVMFCFSTVLMIAAQYTVLSNILPGNQNWIEVVGVALVLIGSIMHSLREIFWVKSNT